MATIYELRDEFNEVMDLLMDDEIDEQVVMDTLESLQFEIHDKADGYAKVKIELEAKVAKIDDEIKRLGSLKKTINNNIERLLNNLTQCMKSTGEVKFDTELFKFSIPKPVPSVVIDIEDAVPDEFTKTKIEVAPDKTKIKEFLKNNTAEWAHLNYNEKVRIK